MAAAPETIVDPAGWTAAVADTDGPQLVVAGPGAGKTEFLVRRALHLIDRGIHPEQILMLSFSRRGAADLRRRVADGLGRSFTTLPASTFHSLAFRMLEAHGAAPESPSLLTGPEQVAVVADLLAGEDPADWPVLYRGLLRTPGFADEVADFVLRCREQLIDPGDLQERAAGRGQWRGLPAFLGRYLAELKERNRIDYGSLQAEAVDLLDEAGVRAAVAEQHPYVLVDEYQDTTVAQARLLERITRQRRNLTAAGDPYQSIYSFRGAEVTNIAEFPAAFPAPDGSPARRLVLTTSFRVPAEILSAAVRVTAGGDLPGAAGPVRPAPGRGSVEVYGFDQLTHEAEWIAGEIERIHLREAIPYRRMAVLVRSTRHLLPELSRALERRGIPHDPPDTRLADHPAVRTVLDCVRIATGTEVEPAVRRLLLGSLIGLPLSAWRDLQRDRAGGGGPWPEILRRRIPGGEELAAVLEDPAWASDAPAAEGFWHVWSSLPQLAAAAVDPRRGDDRAAWSSLAQVLNRLGERDPEATLADYLRWSESEDFEATPLLEYRTGDEDRLALTTLHQAKGRGWDVVFIADAREGVFPDLRTRESLLGSRLLSPTQPEDPAEYARFRLQEEMRLAYTAMCRASSRVVWTCTTAGWDDGRGVPSRFLSLITGTDGSGLGRPGPPGEPSTPLEAEAWLRRMVRDPAERAPRRLAALAALTGPGAWRRRPATDFAGIAAPGPDTGLLPTGLTLSPSQADSYLTCPRRYAIERRLLVEGGGTQYRDFGSLVHAVLEEAERAALERGDDHAELAEALEVLGRVFDPAAFGGEPWSAAWHAKAVRILTRLYERWPGKGRVAAVEHPVEMELHGFTWRGRIDRVEVAGEGDRPVVRIVDYKTGTSLPTLAEAKVSPQLGFYLIAARRDPDLAALGAPGAAEFWYPATRAARITVRELDPAAIDEVTDRLREAAEGIAAEDWAPRTNDRCRRCAVRLVCPEWPEGREAYQG